MKHLRMILGVILLALGLSLAAYADEQINGVGGTYWARMQNFTTTPACVRTAASAACALFPSGDSAAHRARVTVIEADAAGQCCFAGEGALAISSALSITDAAGVGNGEGSCMSFGSSGGVWHASPDRSTMLAEGSSGMRNGLCSIALTYSKETALAVYIPCDETADCTARSAGTCYGISGTPALTDDQVRFSSVVLNCVGAGDSPGMNVRVRKERVRK